VLLVLLGHRRRKKEKEEKEIREKGGERKRRVKETPCAVAFFCGKLSDKSWSNIRCNQTKILLIFIEFSCVCVREREEE